MNVMGAFFVESAMTRDLIVLPGGLTCAVPLTQGKFAIIDYDDFDIVSKHNWCVTNNYVISNKLLLHHLVCGRPPLGLYTDHINGDGLDNRKSNLRFVTKKENAMNTVHNKNSRSIAPNISLCYGGRAYVTIWHNNTHIILGSFPTALDAALAIDDWHRQRNHTTARYNFPKNDLELPRISHKHQVEIISMSIWPNCQYTDCPDYRRDIWTCRSCYLEIRPK